MIQQKQLPRLALFILVCSAAFFLPKRTVAQSIVNVNNVTGTATATVPIYNVTVGDLSAPVALSYTASGLKVEDYDNTVGMGWRLIAGASIMRSVRGFPDDVEYQSDASYSVIKGWLKSGNTAPQSIQSLSFANNGTLNCSNEIADAATIAGNYSYTYDTEPDYFTISAPGLSCSFVFDGTTSHTIKTIPYRDYQISYTADSYGRILTFTVVNDNGVKYYFDRAFLIEHSVDVFNPGTTTAIDPSTLEVFKRDFMMYRNKSNVAGYPIGYPVKYNDQWMLTKMEDLKGNKINFNYETYTIANPAILNKYSYTPTEIVKPDGSGGFTKKLLYGTTTARTEQRLLSISTFALGLEAGTFATEVEFNWGMWPESGSNDDKRLNSITLPVQKTTFDLLYTKKFLSNQSYWYGFGRMFLKGLQSHKTSSNCINVNTQFDFTYYDVNEASNTCYCTPVNSSNVQIDTLINAQDYWGYYNGKADNTNLTPKIYAYPGTSAELFKVYPVPSLSSSEIIIPPISNTDRSVNAHAKDGSLKRIVSPTGAVTELEYENNEFYDNDVNGNVLGGGIRIKKITNNDGLNNNTVTEYSYNDPANTSVTTGRAISVPKFTMAFQNGTTVLNSTYRVERDLNPESKDILYGKVTVKNTGTAGIGKTIYEYNTAGTFGSSAVSGYWDETINFVTRTNLSSPTPCTAIAPSFLKNGKLQYPFTSNANYDFERGQLNTVTNYNEAGTVVAKEEYTYDHSHTAPSYVYGLKLDDLGNTMAAYAKYPINTAIDNFLITKTSKLYNSNSSTPITDVENYEYTAKSSAAAYRVLKSVSKQNSGSTTTFYTRFKYAKEYAATSSGTDDMNLALYNFISNNKNTLIETTQSFVSGSTEKYTGGSFTTFKKFTIGDIPNSGTTVDAFLPYKSYQFINQAGVVSTSFTPSTITSNAFVWDNTAYSNNPTVIEQYSRRGIPQVVTDNSRIPKTILSSPWVNSVKLAEFSNAKPENVGFANFETMFENTFSGGGNVGVSGGRYSPYCLDFQPSTALCRTLIKQPSAKNLIISFWLKDAASSGTVYLCFSKFGCSGTTCTTNPIISFTTGSQWKYYQAVVPWPSSTATTFTVSLSTSAAIKIDDLLVYPDNSSVTTYSYTTNTIGTNLLTAKTGINGIGNTYQYDNAGRLWLVRDVGSPGTELEFAL